MTPTLRVYSHAILYSLLLAVVCFTAALGSSHAAQLGEQRTLVVLINFRNNRVEPYTTQFAFNATFGNANTWPYWQTNGIMREFSYNQWWLAGDVIGWYRLNMTSDGCNYIKMRDLANKAAVHDVVLSSYSRIIYMFPRSSDCAWSGLTFPPGTHLWINGSLDGNADPNVAVNNYAYVLSHELGHSLGLPHDFTLSCGIVTLTPGKVGCVRTAGDLYDTMGSSLGHYTAVGKAALGWAMPPIVVSGDGTWTIEPLEAPGSLALQITRPGLTSFFTVEYRQPIGRDAYLTTSGYLPNGLVIRLDNVDLLDMHPETPTTDYAHRDMALAVGETFCDPDTGVRMTAVSADPAGATAQVTYGSLPC